jgi:methylated-DNA-protein-cysteine methyltransferase related protein
MPMGFLPRRRAFLQEQRNSDLRMASSSPHYARIQSDILAITNAIPVGRVTTFRAIGEYLDVMPRHVAYILATLPEPLASAVLWYRVVPQGGKLPSSKQAAQRVSLSAEGIQFSASGEIADFTKKYIEPEDLKSGVPQQYRDLATISAGNR